MGKTKDRPAHSEDQNSLVEDQRKDKQTSFPGINQRQKLKDYGAKISGLTYHCIHCLTPSESIYRRMGREIKLTTCRRCGQDVDPYIEKEWLLVAMDCILLREEAYRHVLSNRLHPLLLQTLGSSNDLSISAPQLLQFFILSALIQAFLLVQEEHMVHHGEEGNHGQTISFLSLLMSDEYTKQHSLWWIPKLVAFSLLTNLLLIVGIICSFQMYSRFQHFDSKDAQPYRQPQNLALLTTRIFLSIVLPMAFHIITMAAMIWENSTIVRQLASILVLCYQYMATSVTLQLHDSFFAATADTICIQKEAAKKFHFGMIFLTGIVLRSVGYSSFQRMQNPMIASGDSWAVDVPCLLGVKFDRETPWPLFTTTCWATCLS